jgi:hypothetical protein
MSNEKILELLHKEEADSRVLVDGAHIVYGDITYGYQVPDERVFSSDIKELTYTYINTEFGGLIISDISVGIDEVTFLVFRGSSVYVKKETDFSASPQGDIAYTTFAESQEYGELVLLSEEKLGLLLRLMDELEAVPYSLEITYS